MIEQTHRSYKFGSVQGLSINQMAAFTDCFSRSPGISSETLGGRNQPHLMDVEDIGPVVIKRYFRGGIIRHVNQSTYIGICRTRGRMEFEMLIYVRDAGINAPEPVAYATQGSLFYRAWLILKELPQTRSLAMISRSEPDKAKKLFPAVLQQINLLISHGVFHVDMHPGNVLVDPFDRVYIIDFDKSRIVRKNKGALRNMYFRRWKRSVEKHDLPAFLTGEMGKGL